MGGLFAFIIFLVILWYLGKGALLLVIKAGENIDNSEEKTTRQDNFKSKKRGSEMKWISLNESIKVAEYTIDNPLTYVSSGTPIFEEASCIDTKLSVGKLSSNRISPIGYYSSFLEIAPRQRAYYLNWLAGGRKGPLEDIGYVFIFFYGLERRFLVEGKDASQIISEIIKLRKRYDFSNSFLGYSGRFLAYILAKTGLKKLNSKTLISIIKNTEFLNNEEGLAVTLAWIAINNAPIPASLAMELTRNDPRTSRSVVPDRVPIKFQELFKKKYLARFPDNATLTIPKSRKALLYHPASPSLLFHARESEALIPPVLIPDILALKKPFSIWQEIWNDCIEELRPYSRKVQKLESRDSREAFEALPDELKDDATHPDAHTWESIFSDKANPKGFALLEVSELAQVQGIDKRDRLTKKQSQSLVETSEEIGFALEPDTRFSNKSYSWDDLVSLFRKEQSETSNLDSKYQGASLLLELGVAVAAADGKIDPDELTFIKHFLEGQFLLNKEEIFRLEGYKEILVNRPPSINGLGKKIKQHLPENQIEKIGQFLVGVAAADGVIDQDEIKILKKAYKSFGLDQENLMSFIDSISQDADAPVVVKKGKGKKKGEKILSSPAQEEPVAITLNIDRVKDILVNTREVSNLLAEVMVDEEESSDLEKSPAPVVAETIEPTSESVRFEGLGEAYHGLLDTLLTKKLWDIEEFENIIRQFDLMPSGTILEINEWSEDRFEDLLIEEGENIIIHKQIIGEI